MIYPIGYLYLHRELTEKPIWTSSTPEQKVILITLMMMANFKEKEWEWQGKKFKAKPGQFITSLDGIVKNCGKGISIKNVRTALVRFEKLEFLANEPASTGRLITITNWGLYQNNLEEWQTERQRGGKGVATREERNKDNINTLSEIEEIRKQYQGAKSKKVADLKLPSLIKKYGKEEMIRTIERYNKYVEQERKNGFKELKYKNESTFWNGGYIDYLDDNYAEANKANKPKSNVVVKDGVKYENGLRVYE